MRSRRDQQASSAGQGRRLGSWLAIGLLFLQLVIAAGHFHPEDFAFLRGVAAVTGPGGVPLPAGGQPSLPAHDDCPLCFNLHVVGSSVLPTPTTLAAPSEHAQTLSRPIREYRLASAPHLLFQTRAPPVV